MEKMSNQLKKVSLSDLEGSDLITWTKLTIKMKSAASLGISNNEKALLDLKAVIRNGPKNRTGS
jgi:hypothetical protein